jgi:hypothetical protein
MRCVSWGTVMKSLAIGIAALTALLGMSRVSAQPYCAYYADGTRECGIPSLQTCTQSVVGVGGYCGPDETQAIPPNLMQRWRQDPDRPRLFAPKPGPGQPGGSNFLPPPPQESQ